MAFFQKETVTKGLKGGFNPNYANGWSVSIFGSFINFNTRRKIRAAYPYILFVMGCLLIIRGLGLGIPYLSPANFMNMHTAIECHK